MIPAVNEVLSKDITLISYPSKTYKMDMTGKTISGYTDGAESMTQAIYKILNTERYSFIAYSWNYGLYTADLFGMDYEYVCAELERRIEEALLADDRVTSVEDFSFELQGKSKVLCQFTVNTSFGTIDAEKVVEI